MLFNAHTYICLNRKIQETSRIKILSDGTLEIQAVRASDVGQYSCIVKSPGGNETRTAKLSVIELPFSPMNVKALRVDNSLQRAVNVSWTPGFDGNSPIKQYIIQKREVPELGTFFIFPKNCFCDTAFNMCFCSTFI